MVGNLLRGFVDGALSTLGIVIGATSAAPAVIIAAAVGGTVANGIANALSAFSSESASRHAELREIEKALVDRDLRGTALDRNVQVAIAKASVVDGLGTIAGGVIPVLPYVFMPVSRALPTSAGVVIIAISIVGLYLGRVSRRNLALSALKMAVSGIAVAGIVYLIQSLITPQ